MKSNVVSLKQIQYEKQYRAYYSNINNYNYALKLVGTAPMCIIDFTRLKTS